MTWCLDGSGHPHDSYVRSLSDTEQSSPPMATAREVGCSHFPREASSSGRSQPGQLPTFLCVCACVFFLRRWKWHTFAIGSFFSLLTNLCPATSCSSRQEALFPVLMIEYSAEQSSVWTDGSPNDSRQNSEKINDTQSGKCLNKQGPGYTMAEQPELAQAKLRGQF